jgi:hypothetical protein
MKATKRKRPTTVYCADCGRARPGVTLRTFVCRYCLSLDGELRQSLKAVQR